MKAIGGAALCLAILWAAPAEAKSKHDTLRIDVGPIWNQADAESKCRKAARKAGGEWTGEWTTIVPNESSICVVKKMSGGGSSLRWPEPAKPVASGPKVEKLPSGKWTVEAGPIHAQIEADMKCPRAVGSVGGKWTGQWWTTVMGRMSVCEFTR